MSDFGARLRKQPGARPGHGGPAREDQRVPRHAVRHLPLRPRAGTSAASGSLLVADEAGEQGQADHPHLARRMPRSGAQVGSDLGGMVRERAHVRRRKGDRGRPQAARRSRPARRPRRGPDARPIPIRERTSSSSSGRARCSRSTGRSRCWSSSRGGSSSRRCSSIRATSTAPRGSDSWACSKPSTTIARRFSEEWFHVADRHAVRQRHQPADRRGHQGRPDRRGHRRQPKSTNTSSPTRSSGTSSTSSSGTRRPRRSRTKASPSGCPASSAPASRRSRSCSG